MQSDSFFGFIFQCPRFPKFCLVLNNIDLILIGCILSFCLKRLDKPTIVAFLQCQNGWTIVTGRYSPQCDDATALFTVARIKCSRAKVTCKGVETVRFWNIAQIRFPVRAHVLNDDTGVLHQDIVDVASR